MAYEAPKTEALELSFEGGIMTVSGGTNYSDINGGVSGNDRYDDDDIF